MNQLAFKDGEFPAAKRDIFLVFVCGLFLANFSGWADPMTLIPNMVGLFFLFAAWVFAMRAQNATFKQFYGVWWLGLGFLLVAQASAYYLKLKAETG